MPYQRLNYLMRIFRKLTGNPVGNDGVGAGRFMAHQLPEGKIGGRLHFKIGQMSNQIIKFAPVANFEIGTPDPDSTHTLQKL